MYTSSGYLWGIMLLDKPKDIREVQYQIGVPDEDRQYYLEKKDFDLPKSKIEFESPDKIPSPFIGVDEW